MNTWMNNPQYLAQVGHFLGGGSVILLATLFSVVLGAGWTPVLVTLVVGVIAASVKEYWYDMLYELPKQMWGDSIMDWCFYMLGAVTGMGLAALAFHLAQGHCS